MIRIWDIEDGELRPTDACYTLEWLKDIMTAFPKDYMQVYRYIFYMSCLDEQLNPYRNTPEVDKSEEICRMLAKGETLSWIPDDLKIEKAVTECRKLYSTPTQEVY